MFNLFGGGEKKRRKRDLSRLRKKKEESLPPEPMEEDDDDEGWEEIPPEEEDFAPLPPPPEELQELDLAPLDLDEIPVELSSEWQADIDVLGDSNLDLPPLPPLEGLPSIDTDVEQELPTRREIEQEPLPPLDIPPVDLGSELMPIPLEGDDEDMTAVESDILPAASDIPPIPQEDLSQLEQISLDFPELPDLPDIETDISSLPEVPGPELELPPPEPLGDLAGEDLLEIQVDEAILEDEDQTVDEFSSSLIDPSEQTIDFTPLSIADSPEEATVPSDSHLRDDPERTIPHQRAMSAPLYRAEPTKPHQGLSPSGAAASDPLAKLLLEKGLLQPHHLQQVEGILQNDPNQKLGPLLVQMGLITQSQLTSVMAEAYQIPTLDLSQIQPDPKVLKLVAPSVATRLQILPLYFEGGALVVAMANPFDLYGKKELENLLPVPIKATFAPEEEIRRLQSLWYKRKEDLKPIRLSSSKTAQTASPAPVTATPQEEESVLDIDEADLLDDDDFVDAEELLEEEDVELVEEIEKPIVKPEPVTRLEQPTKKEITVEGLKLPSPDTDLNILLPKDLTSPRAIPAEACEEEFSLKWAQTPSEVFRSRLEVFLEHDVLQAQEVSEEEFRIACEGAS